MTKGVTFDQPYDICLIVGPSDCNLATDTTYTQLEWLPKPTSFSVNRAPYKPVEVAIEVVIDDSVSQFIRNNIKTGAYIGAIRPFSNSTEIVTKALLRINNFYWIKEFDNLVVKIFCEVIPDGNTFCVFDKIVRSYNRRNAYSKLPFISKLDENEIEKIYKCYENINKKDTAMISAQHNSFVMPTIERVIINNPAVIVFWSDGDKTIGKSMSKDTFDPEIGLSMAISRKFYSCAGSANPRGAFKKQIEIAENYSDKTAERKKNG